MKGIWIALAILVIVHLLDIFTTYEIICVRGGIELNPNFVWFTQKIGFVPTAIVKIFSSGLAFYFLYRVISKNVKKTILVWCTLLVFIVIPFLAVVFNFNTMIYQTRSTQIEPFIQDIPLAQTEFRHQDFCKLIP
jgi:uncharacterized membrane protein